MPPDATDRQLLDISKRLIAISNHVEVRIMNDKAGRMQAAMAQLGLLRQGS